MLKRFLHFIKYNNATVLILALILVASGGVFAATETGQEFIGTQQSRIEGRDNTLLLELDLATFDMDYKIEKIEEDEKYYYVTYTCLDLLETNDAWEYQLNEKVRPVSKKLKGDLGKYLAEELKEEYQARVKELESEQKKAEAGGQEIRIEVTEYTGLIGQTLKIAEKVFSGYEAVKTSALPSPENTNVMSLPTGNSTTSLISVADNLTEIYDEYIARMDPDADSVLGVLDNCPEVFNPDQADKDEDGLGDECDEYFTLTPVLDDEGSSTDDVINDGTGETSEASSTPDGTDFASSTNDVMSDGESEDDGSVTGTEEDPDVEVMDLEQIENNNN